MNIKSVKLDKEGHDVKNICEEDISGQKTLFLKPHRWHNKNISIRKDNKENW